MKRLVAAVGAALLLAASGPPRVAGLAAAGQTAQAAKPKSAPASPSFTPDALDKLLAPIALYPDSLLAQMLLCATNPAKLGALEEWLASQTLKGTELQDAATKSGFEPSFVALVLFPQVISSMASQMPWTTQLGQAFTADRSAVFAGIQRLRAKAQQAGKLKDTPQQDVESKTTSSGQQVIVIEPANPQVVYVPQYNATTVYTTAPTTVVVQEQDNDAAIAAGLIGFTAGIAIGAAIDNDYYYGPYGWRGGGAYMYDDAWDDYYDDREDAREDWADNREDLAEERGERAGDAREQRTERQQTTQEQRTERTQTRQENRPDSATQQQRRTDAQAKASEAKASGATSAEARGYSGDKTRAQPTKDRSGTRSDAFTGYSSGGSERGASKRGNSSRSSSRGGGSRRR